MDDLLTTRQLQALLHVDRITIYRMLGDGRLAGFKVGGQWRFARRDIEAWLRQQQTALPEAGDGPAAADAGDDSLTATALPLTCVQAIQSIYAGALDVAAVTVDSDGAPLTDISSSCAFCDLILSTEPGRRLCAAAWLAAGRAGRGASPFHTCHVGLLVAAAPVQVDRQPVASAVCCQFTADAAAWQPDLPALAAGLGLPPAQLRAAAAGVRAVPAAALPRIAALLAQTADTFAKIGQERLELVGRLQRIAEITHL